MLNGMGMSGPRPHARAAVWLSALLVVMSCRGSDGASDGGGATSGGGNAPTQAQIDDFFGVTCDHYRRCCAEGGLSIESLADCEVKVSQSSELGELLRRGALHWVEPAFSQCLTALRDAPCTGGYGAESNESCVALFTGSVPNGGACIDGLECARAGELFSVCLRADGIPEDQPGVCRPLVRARLGDVCITAFNGSGSFSLSTPQPEASLSLGYCNLEDDGLFCDRTDGTCHALLNEGAACGPVPCRIDLYCDPAGRICKPRMPPGGPCTTEDECVLTAFSCKDGTCQQPTIVDSEVCSGDLD
jgi:hypothetical protein